MLTAIESTGRWLGILLFRGQSRSALVELGLWDNIEKVISKRTIWIQLLSGDLKHVNNREQFLGKIFLEEQRSIDGAENNVRSLEVILYYELGMILVKALDL